MIIKNVTIVNFNQTIPNADVEIKDQKIFKITKRPGQGQNILIPGFIDQHIHGFFGHDAMDSQASIEFMSQKLVATGTTSFLPTLMTSEHLEASLKAAAQAQSQGSKILGLHLEGPFISVAKKGAHDEQYILRATAKRLTQLLQLGANQVRKMTIAPENFDLKFLPLLFAHNVIPSLGHTNTDAFTAQKYFDLGVPSATHLWNAMSGIKNREPGLIETVLTRPDVTTEMILDFVHVDPINAQMSIEAKGVETITLVTDSIRPAGLPDGDSMSGGLKVTKKGAWITLKGTKTIAGSGVTMYDNFKNVLSLNYDLEAAVAMTSYNAALLLGEDKMGLIKKGCWADLVLLDQALNIKQVFVNGETKYDQNHQG